MRNSEKKHRIRNDLILIALTVSLAIAIGLSLYFLREDGETVRVTVHGETFGVYSLTEDRTVEIRSEEGINRLVIRDGEAFVEHADCPDGICAAHKPIKRMKESIVCLPHGVVITVEGKAADGSPDLVV